MNLDDLIKAIRRAHAVLDEGNDPSADVSVLFRTVGNVRATVVNGSVGLVVGATAEEALMALLRQLSMKVDAKAAVAADYSALVASARDDVAQIVKSLPVSAPATVDAPAEAAPAEAVKP